MKVLRQFVWLAAIGLSLIGFSQTEELPFRELSAYTDAYTANTVAARMIESLGFRYYWASEGLRKEDLNFKLSEDTRSIKATMVHIYELSLMIRNSAEKRVNVREDHSELDAEVLRVGTLNNLKVAVDVLGKGENLESYKILFEAGSVPFWNQINGPISDALWHCGQVVMMRRLSGNPINPKLNHFTGKVSD